MKQQDFHQQAEAFDSVRRHKKRWHRVVGALGCVAVFCTTYALILPAITMSTKQSYCGLTEHTHSDACYSTTVSYTCGMTEGEGHTHTASCYTQDTQLTCGQDETPGHSHSESCYDGEGALICGQAETEGHTHSDSCYTTRETLTCGMEETAGHTHTDACGTETTSTLTCTQTEHTHTLICYSNPNADVETESVWKATLPELTDDWCADVVAIAQSQIGYQESTANYQLDSSGNMMGYTRYGDWYGMPYENWCAMFASFCIRYAEIPAEAFPVNSSCQGWIEELQSDDWEMYYTRTELADMSRDPAPSDVIFFDFNGDGSSDHVGLVEYYEDGTVHTIEGNTADQVARRTYDATSTKILGYATLSDLCLHDSTSAAYATYDASTTFDSSKINVSTQDHSGTIINLFDYWVTPNRTDSDNYTDVKDKNDYGGDGDAVSYLRSGINAGHALKFTQGNRDTDKSTPTKSSNSGLWNVYTGGKYIYAGIVANTLKDGYPQLAIDQSLIDTVLKNNATRMWLESDNDGTSSPSGSESLAYLFDPDIEHTGKASYKNVTGLTYLDAEGYYTYDSTKFFAQFCENAVVTGTDGKTTSYTNHFILTDNSSVTGNTGREAAKQFFPFNSFDAVKKKQDTASDVSHYFGLTLTTRFLQENDGYSKIKDSTKDDGSYLPTTFDFSGDDDVWIFVDDVLVADLGGIHSAATVTINFVTGEVSVNAGQTDTETQKTSTTLYAAFDAAEKAGTVEWNDKKTTFKNGTYHTLKFYYLERGNGSSNLKLKFNLTEVPVTGIYKVDQYGNPVEGAHFSVYQADADYKKKKEEPIFQGTTDTNGQLLFEYKSGGYMTIDDIQKEYGNNLLLIEDGIPDGYRRVYDTIKLRIQNGLLLCDNTYDSGVWSANNLLVISPMYLKLVGYSSDDVHYFDVSSNTNGSQLTTKGTLFAVVLKYSGTANENLSTYDWHSGENWEPVYGDDTHGYQVIHHQTNSTTSYVDINEETKKTTTYDTYLDAILAAAKNQQTVTGSASNVFSEGTSGNMRLLMDALPGDITTYYQNLGSSSRADTKYTIGYFWTSAKSVAEAKPENTYFVYADESASFDNDTNSKYVFQRTYGATINVPDLTNVFYVQKRTGETEADELLNGSIFGLYSVEEFENQVVTAEDGTTSTESVIYYLANKEDSSEKNIHIKLELDTDLDSKGEATVVTGYGEQTVTLDEDKKITQKQVTITSSETGTYEVNQETGVITVNTVEITSEKDETTGVTTETTKPLNTYYITPAQTATTLAAGTKENNVLLNLSGEDGTATFTNVYQGQYYVREIKAPLGYSINCHPAMVLVNEEAIYANAGTADDGITVGRGPGYVVSSLSEFASGGDIDDTLTWVFEQLQVSPASTSFKEVNDLVAGTVDASVTWGYLTENYNGLSTVLPSNTDGSDILTTYLKYTGATTSGNQVTFNYSVNTDREDDYWTLKVLAQGLSIKYPKFGDNRRLYTNVGWSYYRLYQDYYWAMGRTKDSKTVVSKHLNEGAYYNDKLVTFTDGVITSWKDISNLFSRSTVIMVADQKENGTLTVSNTVNNAIQKNDTTAFTYNLELKDAKGNGLSDQISYTIYQTGETSAISTETTNEEGKATFQLSNGQYAVFTNIPADTVYTVTESPITAYNLAESVRDSGKATITKEEKVTSDDQTSTTKTVEISGEDKTLTYTVTGTLYWSVAGGVLDTTSTVDYVNTYVPSIVVHKQSSPGQQALSGAEFSLEKMTDANTVDNTFTKQTVTTDANGDATFKQIENGTYRLTEEKAPAGYNKLADSITFTVSNGTIVGRPTMGETTFDWQTNKENGLITIIVPNSTGYELPHTGGIGREIYTYCALVVLTGVALGGCVMRKRVRRR
jgi:hypothetical protein